MSVPDESSVQPVPHIGAQPITATDILKAMTFPLLIAGLFLVAHYSGLKDWAVDREELEASLEEWGWKAPALFIGAHSFLPLMFIPRSVLALIGGFLFGWPSIPYTWLGAAIGESIAYSAARFLGRPLLSKLLNRKARRAARWIEKEGFWGVLILRLLPFVPTDVINFGSGFVAVRYRDYLAGTALGVFPGCVLFSLYGQLMDGQPLGILMSLPLFLIPLAMGFGVARWRYRQQQRINAQVVSPDLSQ